MTPVDPYPRPEPLSPPFPLERCDEDEVLYDRFLRPYTPEGPVAGRPRSVNLLYQVLQDAPEPARWQRLIAAVREGVGWNRTVWGVHRAGDGVRVTLHFPLRGLARSGRHRQRMSDLPEPLSWPRVVEALSPVLDVAVEVPGHAPVTTVTVVLDDGILARGAVDEVRIRLPAGLAWRLGPEGPEHDGQLRLFDLHDVSQVQHLLEYQANGLLHGSACGVDIQSLLLPQLYQGLSVALDTGRRSESITFVGVSLAALTWALDQHGWPRAPRRFLATDVDGLDHLRWDVGLDYVSRDGALRWVGSGVYGTL